MKKENTCAGYSQPLAVTSEQLVRYAMRERGEATRPQLAAATGLSQVTVGRVVARLCRSGELRALGEVASGGGRPVELYHYNAGYELSALFSAHQEGAVLSGRLELLDSRGKTRREERARFALLHEQSLDDWLDAAVRRHRIGGITLALPDGMEGDALRRHLKRRYDCPVRCVTGAMALAGDQENELTLYLPRGGEPVACLRRWGRLQPCGLLGLLPQPSSWESLNYEDHTLVEEMVARLLLMLACTLAPTSMTLHADYWTERLINRIRYNFSTKMKSSSLPMLRFAHLQLRRLQQGVRRLSLER